MHALPEILTRGERARLFPVLAETSKEGRTLSIVLACMENVDEFGKALIADLGIKCGARSKLETYTEVVCKRGGDRTVRPDGLLVLKTGTKTWTALVEAKIGNAELTAEQIESYIEVAKLNGVDAVITISNQFAPLPTHHPVTINVASLRNVALLHWSWMYILTQAKLQINNGEITDADQRSILIEMVRFLLHPSAGVKGFDQMPQAWTQLVGMIQTGGSVSSKLNEAQEVVGAWHQELQDLSFILSRQIDKDIDLKIPRAHIKDPSARLKSDLQLLADERCLKATFVIPNAVAPLEVVADLRTRSVFASMKLEAPGDRQSTKARLNWLLRQLQKSNTEGIHVRFFWPGRTPFTQHPLSILREQPEIADIPGKVVATFEVLMARDLGSKFAQRKNFIIEFERTVSDFYEQVGQHLKAWQAPPPKVKLDPDDESASTAVSEVQVQSVAATDPSSDGETNIHMSVLVTVGRDDAPALAGDQECSDVVDQLASNNYGQEPREIESSEETAIADNQWSYRNFDQE